MGKTLFLAEKPDVSKTLKKGLEKYGSFDRIEWGYESEKYIITSAVGHIYSLKQPKHYDNWMSGSWDLDKLPWYPPNDKFEYVPNADASDVEKKVRKIMKREDIDLIINACDAEREGELIFWEIYDKLNLKTPVKRFWASAALNKGVIQRTVEEDSFKDEDFYAPRRLAAYARQHADNLIGMNFTVGFTAKAGTLMNMGRVKAPTIAILAERRKEIEEFKPEDYYEIHSTFKASEGEYVGKWFDEETNETKIIKYEDAEDIVEAVSDEQGSVFSKEIKEVKKKPPKLFNITELSRQGISKFGMTSDQVLKIAQSLYETHQVLSYPRSESQTLGEEHVSILKPTLESINFGDYESFATEIIGKGIKTSKHFIDDDGLTDHHAIIPMDKSPNLSSMSADEVKIYDLVVKRFLSVFYPDAVDEKTKIVTEVNGNMFKTSGTVNVFDGWRKVYDGVEEGDDEKKSDDEEDRKLPSVEEEEIVESDAERLDKKTKPPGHYTESSLLRVMSNPQKFLESKELKKVLKDNDAGLGTGATRPSIIKELRDKGYIDKKKSKFICSDKGMDLYNVSPEKLRSPIITAEWERELQKVAEGKKKYDDFMNEIKKFVEENLDDLRLKEIDVKKPEDGEDTGWECHICKKPVIKKDIKSKKGRFVIYSCESATREDPCMTVFEKVFRKKLTKKQLKNLFNGEETGKIENLKKKNGDSFSASLKYDEKEKKIVFAKSDAAQAPKKVEIKCPICDGELEENAMKIGCSNWRVKGCKFTVWKNNSKTISTKDVKDMMENGETREINDFVKKGKDPKDSKNQYSGYYTFDEKNQQVKLNFGKKK